MFTTCSLLVQQLLVVKRDLRLPKMDGQEVLEVIKTDLNLKDIPVVVMTVSRDDEDWGRCKTRNVDAYLTKPVDTEKFLDLVRDLKRFWHEDVILPTGHSP